MKVPGFIGRAFGTVSFAAKEHSPELLLVAGAVTLVATVVTACKATPKFVKVLEKHNEELELNKKAEEVVENAPEGSDIRYTPEDSKNDRIGTYTRTAVSFVKIYWKPIVLGTVSIGCFCMATGIVKKRYLGMAAAYLGAVKEKGLLEDRIIEEYGEEKLRELKRPKAAEIIESVAVEDENGDMETKTKVSYDTSKTTGLPPYARFFDASCPEWDEDPEANKIFLWTKQNWFNARLQTRGYLFLNEVLVELGFEPTQAGQVLGWKFYKDPAEAKRNGAANYVDLGVFVDDTNAGRRFVNCLENVVVINPNVDKMPIIGTVGLKAA